MANKTKKKETENVKKTSKSMLAIIIIGSVLVVASVVALFLVTDKLNSAQKQTTTEKTTTQVHINPAYLEMEELWEEHTALFEELKRVYYLGEYENYKSLIPLLAWEKMAESEGITLEEAYAKAEKELSEKGVDESSEIYFYVSKIEEPEKTELDHIYEVFGGMYEIDETVMTDIYSVDVDEVVIRDGKREVSSKVYYSMVIDGERYLATDTGFVG